MHWKESKHGQKNEAQQHSKGQQGVATYVGV